MENQKNGKIGVFDSGIGGVTVLREILKVLPQEDYIYYSDSIHNPYGNKNTETIIAICEHIVEYLLEQGCKAIVIACNTASARAVEYLRTHYPTIPFIAIEPAYKVVHDYAYEGATLVMATQGTIESERFQKLYHTYDNHKTTLLPCIGLADVIEEGNPEKIKEYLQQHLTEYAGKIENVVLGCTHYPLAKQQMQEILGDVQFFDGANRLAFHLKQILEEQDLCNNAGIGNVQFMDTSKGKYKEERFFEILKEG